MADIKGVEIFAEGVWNGHKITSNTLKNIVDGFNKTNAFLKPVLKLGHNDDQNLLKQDGLPAAGWVSKVYIQGKKLLADFTDIPKKIADLIKNRSYRKVSVEIFSGIQLEGQKFPNLLGAVALLGADTPAVLTLADIPTDFKKAYDGAVNFTFSDKNPKLDFDRLTFTQFDYQEDSMDQKDDKKDQDHSRIDDVLKSVEELKKMNMSLTNQIEEAKKLREKAEQELAVFKKGTDEKIRELEASKKEAEVEKFTMGLKAKGLIAPSMEAHVKALLSGAKSTFSIGDKKDLSAGAVIEELLSLASDVFSINKEERSRDLKPEGSDSLEKQHKAIEEYATQNKVSYSQAYRALSKEGK